MASLSEKIACIGNKHDIESSKQRIMQTLTDINLVNFNNVERYNKNDNNETLQAFVDLVNASTQDTLLYQVVSDLNADNNRLNITVKTLTSVKQMVSNIRDMCTLASDEKLTYLQRNAYHAQWTFSFNLKEYNKSQNTMV